MSEDIEQPEEMSFAELLAETSMGKGRLKPGERIQAPIVKITPEWIFIDLGEKNEGYLDRKEFLDEQGELTVREGDPITAYFLRSSRSEKLFTTKISSAAAGQQFLEDAWHNGIPVEGLVEKETKGGFEVKLGGVMRGFCPYSQMTLRRTDDPGAFIGQRLIFNISEYKENGRNIILSRRSILLEEQEARKEELRSSLQAGSTVRGIITAIHKFGVFVDLGGIQGLIPASEIDWDRSKEAGELFTIGQEVSAVIMNIDWEKDRISLSVKATVPDPWDQAPERYLTGSFHTGSVARLADFGAFVTLEPGVDGLIHISKMGRGKKINHPREVLKEGQLVEVQVEKLEFSQK
ncbi:MAG: S1 RNA-binding domain-containing protein, partial [Smithellaceae bacterium]|nr:S1 RNA-binding domain-containing protein [Smithellaceae bacterium]